MTDTDNGGKAVDSPTTEGADQAKSTTDQILDAVSKDSTDQSGQDKPDGSQTTDTGKSEGDTKSELPDKESLPFDQHPKWQSARQAERRVQEILEKHGYDSIDDLESAVTQEQSLRQLIGNRDAEELVSDYEEFQRVKRYWAEQEAAKREADETPEETIDRLKREKREVEDRVNREKADQEARKNSERIIQEFDNGIRDAVKSLPDMDDADRRFLTEYLGVDNEMASVDPTNPTAVKQAKEAVMQRFNNYVKGIEQRAIDKYVAGKSTITPITPTETATKTEAVKEKTEWKPGTTVDEANASAKDELMEKLTQLRDAP